MSDNQDFQPLTPQLGIAGSSYQLQMGKVNQYWAIRLVKGRDVLASKVYNDIPEPEEIPLGNHLTGWVLSVLAIPNLNSFQIQKTVSFIRQKAMRTLEDQKRLKETGGKSESSSIVLEKVPDTVQVKRPQAAGWVKEAPEAEAPSPEIQAEIAQLSPALAASNKIAVKRPGEAGSSQRRALPKIPTGEGFVPNESPKIAAAAAPSQSVKGELDQILERLLAVEARVEALEQENRSLRSLLEK